MNLWAKSLRQLSFVAVALFFFSCEDENTLLGFKNPVPKFNVSFVEIPLTSNSLLIDGIVTDSKGSLSATNPGAVGNLLIGQYQDAELGNIKAESFLQVYPAGATQIPADAIFDSVTLSIRYNFYSYGFSGQATEKFTIHELYDSLPRDLTVRYKFDQPAPAYNGTPMATAGVTVRADSLLKQFNTPSTQQDTLVTRARLSDDFGRKIFRLSQEYSFLSGSSLSANVQYREFLNQVRGLAFIPSESNGILGIRILNNLSAVTVHYRTLESGAVKDTLSRSYGFNLPSFTRLEADRAGTALANAVPYQNISVAPESGRRYIQNGSPVITKVDLANFYAFADTVGNVLINEASLVIDGVESPVSTPAIGTLGYKVMNEDNSFANRSLLTTDSLAMTPYLLANANPDGVLVPDGKNYIVKNDIDADPAELDYTDGRYFGYLTFFFQKLLKERNDSDGVNDTRLRYVGLFPLSPSVASSVSRTAFNAENVKLRIYYTKPTLTSTPN